MDVPVPAETRRRRKRRRWLSGGLALLGLAIVTLGLSRLRPAAPQVEIPVVEQPVLFRALGQRQSASSTSRAFAASQAQSSETSRPQPRQAAGTGRPDACNRHFHLFGNFHVARLIGPEVEKID